MLTDWCGDDGELVGLDARLQAPDYSGTRRGSPDTSPTSRKPADGNLVKREVAGTNQRGQQTIVATATVALPSRS